jgi:ribosomal protein S18 acetylase RimI-like enzyme
MDINIRKCTINDIQEIAKIGPETARATYEQLNMPDEIDHYLSLIYTEDALKEELNDAKSIYYFAETGDQKVAAFMKVNIGNGPPELENKNGLEIQRLYVRSEFKGIKIGQTLMNLAFSIAKENGMGCVWLSVWEYNHQAIGFYHKHGFVKIGSYPFYLHTTWNTADYMMLELSLSDKETDYVPHVMYAADQSVSPSLLIS